MSEIRYFLPLTPWPGNAADFALCLTVDLGVITARRNGKWSAANMLSPSDIENLLKEGTWVEVMVMP